MEGWIKIYRDITKHWIWNDPVKFKWWIDMLLMANHEDKKINIGMKLVVCKRGQSVMSLSSWAKRWGVSRDRVRAFFKLLENDAMIEHTSNTKFTQITICNYDSYQDDLTTNSQQTHNKLTTNSQQTHTNKNDKNDKNIIYANAYTSDCVESDAKEEPVLTKNPEIAKAYKDYYNRQVEENKSQMPRIKSKIENNRLAMLKARIKEYGDEKVKQVIDLSTKSSFLGGGGGKGFVANFEWIMRPNNFPKILDGNYNDIASQQANKGRPLQAINEDISKQEIEREKYIECKKKAISYEEYLKRKNEKK